MAFDEVDMIKIAIAVASMVALYLFRRRITSMMMDLIGGDVTRYEDEPTQDILRRVEARIKEVIR